MKNKLCVTALLSFTALAGAQTNSQTTQGQGTNAKPSAYGSAYQGVSQPSDDQILVNPNANREATGNPPAVASQPVYVPPPPPAPVAQAPRRIDPNGIVEVPVADEPAPTRTAEAPVLRTHGFNPDAEIVTAVPQSPNTLPEGTPFHARLVEQLSAETITPGTPFSAQLTQDVIHMGSVVIPAGSYVHGRVTYVSAGRRIGGQSTMRLRPEEVVLPDGTHYHFRGVVTQTVGSATKTNAEGEVVAKGHPVRTASEYGMSAGSGAVIGAVVGGPVGAGVGAGIGAGVMTVHWLREKNAAVLPAGSSVTFGLSTPISLTPSTITPGMAANSQVQAAPPVSTYVEPKVQN
jgi:hypothetical protein